MSGLFWKIVVEGDIILFSSLEDAEDYLVDNGIYPKADWIPCDAIILVDVDYSVVDAELELEGDFV